MTVDIAELRRREIIRFCRQFAVRGDCFEWLGFLQRGYVADLRAAGVEVPP